MFTSFRNSPNPLSCWPPFCLVMNWSEASQKVASNLLKVAKQVAYGYAIIATRAFRARQNPYGFRATWSWKNISTDFSILRDLLRNWFLGEIKLLFFSGPGVDPYQKLLRYDWWHPYGLSFAKKIKICAKTPMGVIWFEVHFQANFLGGSYSFVKSALSCKCFTWQHLYNNLLRIY